MSLNEEIKFGHSFGSPLNAIMFICGNAFISQFGLNPAEALLGGGVRLLIQSSLLNDGIKGVGGGPPLPNCSYSLGLYSDVGGLPIVDTGREFYPLIALTSDQAFTAMNCNDIHQLRRMILHQLDSE
ncbi:hypothetical protein OUZ56_005616 [Daphnia magna]|uniref:Uncharacterized protein n=1 Tax=Daphnia magna TaxID=35525 RepID=A0ABQ9YUL9_9CRUS|nr:hypothetical protein OUZ56_005616 [Daphnia magna]